jgi:hypothetical protein
LNILFLVAENCFVTSWNPVGEIMIKIDRLSTFAVDNDFNIYTSNWNSHTLQKWSAGVDKPINLFKGQFPESPIFYHSLSRSLYFFYVFNNNPGIYKLVDGSSIPVNVVNASGNGWRLGQLDTSCRGLYVNSAGDIFLLDGNHNRVVKWLVNATSGIHVAGRNENGSGPDNLAFASGLSVDEVNDAVYVLTDLRFRRITKYTNGSLDGLSVFGGGPTKFLSDVLSEYVEPLPGVTKILRHSLFCLHLDLRK